MKQFAIIGVDSFAKRVLEELIPMDCEILLIDRQREVVDYYKDDVNEAYIADVIDQETLERLIPDDVDSVVIDLGKNVEASILAVNYLKKMGQKNIYVKAETDQHGEILTIVGADHVIYPNREAARRLTPQLFSENLFNFMPIGNGIVMAEVELPDDYHGKTLEDSDIRKKLGVNAVARRASEGGEFQFLTPDEVLNREDILLIVGSEEAIESFTGSTLSLRKKGLVDLFKKFFAAP